MSANTRESKKGKKQNGRQYESSKAAGWHTLTPLDRSGWPTFAFFSKGVALFDLLGLLALQHSPPIS